MRGHKNLILFMEWVIPQEVRETGKTLIEAGFSAYLVGGCVRDMLLESPPAGGPKDWDIATSATPDRIQELFPDSVYENAFGTVGVKTRSGNSATEVVEVTTFRAEGRYSDHRHPDKVKFAQTIEEDLSRRDFTINAIALDMAEKVPKNITDPFNGQNDLKKKLVRAVRNPDQRFQEDALRLIKAVRMVSQLDFTLEHETGEAIVRNALLLQHIAKERIRDEFEKIIMTDNAAQGMIFLEKYGLLPYVLLEVVSGIGVDQNHHHIYTVWEHSVRTLDYAARKRYSLVVRLAALLHDVGKPATKSGSGENATFYSHDAVGSRIARDALGRLKFSSEIADQVYHLIRYHMFYYNVGEVTEAGVRRFISRVGAEHLDEFIQLREADRIGSGVPKAQPYRLRHLLFMIDKVRKDPISPKMLAINGTDIMKVLGIGPGPRVGWIQKLLLEEVLQDSRFNTKECLLNRVQELHARTDDELSTLIGRAERTRQEFESVQEEVIKTKHRV